MFSPEFTDGGGSSNFYGGSTSFSGRSSNFYNHNFSTLARNLHHPYYQTQHEQQIPPIFINPSSQITQSQTSNLIGKRTFTEFQSQSQNILYNNNLNLHNYNYLNNTNNNNNTLHSNLLIRSVKPRNFQHSFPMSPLTPMDFTSSPHEFIGPSFSSPRLGMSLHSNPNIQNPLPMNNFILQDPFPINNSILQNTNFSNENSDFAEIQSLVVPTSHDPDKKMMYDLEKKLHEDIDDEEDWSLAVSGIINTNNVWSETIRNLNSFEQNPIQKLVSFSPTFSTTSLNSSPSSIVSPASEFSKQLLIEAATAISEGKMEYAKEILSRFSPTQNPRLKFDRWLLDCMASALKSRVNNIENPPPVAELFAKEHADSTQLLFDNSLCFKLSFMAANIAILEAAFGDTTKSVKNLCVVDFDIGNGKQYINLLQELHARLNGSPAMLKITTVTMNIDNENLKTIGELLGREAESLGIGFQFKPVNLKLTELTRESLTCDSEDILAVNFAFNLYKMPDESVSTENPRDALLRQVKSLSPSIVTILEQELNTNTALFVSRVAETLSYYGTLLESIEFAMDRDSYERLKLDKGLSRKMRNAVACEGRDRVERCEVFGKWRARMSMSGFRLNPMSPKLTESITSRLIQGSRITVHEENGGVCFGWMGRTLTVASSWC